MLFDLISWNMKAFKDTFLSRVAENHLQVRTYIAIISYTGIRATKNLLIFLVANHTDHTHLVHEDDVGKVDTFNLGFPKVTLCLNSMHSKMRIAEYFEKISDKINKNGNQITLTMFQQVLELYYVGDPESQIASSFEIGTV